MHCKEGLIRFILTAAAAVIIAAGFCGALTAADDAAGIAVEINGRGIVFSDQQPVIIDGRTLVPVRGIFEQLGYDVKWNQATNTATLSNGANDIILILGNSMFIANGAPYALDVPAQIIGGRTMLPFRAVLESAGCAVDWDVGRRTVIIAAAPAGKPVSSSAIAGKAISLREGSAYANLYLGPGVYHDLAASILPGDTGIVVDVSDGWYFAEFGNGLMAWVSGDVVTVRDGGSEGGAMTPRDFPALFSGVWAKDSADGVFTEYVRLSATGDYSGIFVSNTLHRELGFTTYYERGTYRVNPTPDVNRDGTICYVVDVTRQAYVTNGYYTNPDANPGASPAFSSYRPATRYMRMISDEEYRYCGDSAYNRYYTADVMPPENWSDGVRRLGDAASQGTPASVSGWQVRTGVNGETLTGKFNRNTGYLIEGKAVLRSGTVYEGVFDQNNGLLIEGSARLASNGAVYEGAFDKDTGNLINGKMTLGNGDVYIGVFDRINGRMTEGEAALSNGSGLEGTFDRDTGQFSSGRRTTSGGSVYEGAFGEDGYLSKGRFTAADGASIEGSFSRGYPVYGTALFAKGYVYEGSFDGVGQPLNGTLTLDGKLYCTYLNGAVHISGAGGSSIGPDGGVYGRESDSKAEQIDWSRSTISGAGAEKAGRSR